MASKFTERLLQLLAEELKGKFPALQIYKDKSVGITGICCDIIMVSDSRLVIIELESHRQDPSNNIAKIHYSLKCEPSDMPIAIVQLFSPFYREHTLKRKISEALGSMLEEKYPRVSYKPIDLNPVLGLEEFKSIYKNPEAHEEKLRMLARDTSLTIVEFLQKPCSTVTQTEG